MITEALLSLVVATLTGMLNLAPTWTFDMSGISTNAGSIAGLVSAWNGYFPVVTFGTCLGLVFGFKVGMLGWRFILFVYHQFWGSS